MPAFEHGDFRLYETQAILRYLDTCSRSFVRAGRPRAAARMNQIIGINDWYFFPKWRRRRLPARWSVRRCSAWRPTKPVAGLSEARTCFAELDRLLGEQRFLAGEQVSIADLMLAPQIDFLAATPEGKALLAAPASRPGSPA